MFFRKKKKSEVTSSASEYKRGYYDGYNNGLNGIYADHSGFHNQPEYLKGYNYGYQKGSMESRKKDQLSKQINQSTSTTNKDHFDQVNIRKEIGLSNSINSNTNPNTHNNFYKRF